MRAVRCAAFATGLLLAVGMARGETSGQQRAEDAGKALLGKPAPAMVLESIDGEPIDLGRLYGNRALYLKFWATWCVPCRQQMPHFEQTFEHAGPDLAVIAIDVGFNETKAGVEAYRRRLGLKMPIVIDDGRLAGALGLRVTPQHVVIDKTGKIIYVGHLADERLEAALRAAQSVPTAQAVGGEGSVPRGEGSAGGASPLATGGVLGIGMRVPDTSLRAIDGTAYALGRATARPTVLLFVSPWCESYLAKSRPQQARACRQARELAQREAPRAAERWIVVSSGLWATAEDLADYARAQRLQLPLVLDESGDLFREFGIRDVPSMVRLSPSGVVLARTRGAAARASAAPIS